MRAVRVAGATLLLLVLVLGIPLGLWVVGEAMLPSSLPTWDQIQLLLTTPLSGNFLIGALIIVGWIAWASFTIAVLAEVAALLRGRRAPRLPALGAQQRLAAVLLGTILLAVTASPASTVAAHTPEPVTAAASQATAPFDHDITTDRPDTTADPDPDPPAKTVLQTCLVQPGDTLWGLAATHLGDGHRWREIADLNYGITQPDGSSLIDAHWIEPGWQLRLPTTTPPAAPEQDRVVVVAAGDTLYGIAEDELGDGDRHPELMEATQDLQQPDGTYLTDPDLIQPGWQVVIPGHTTPTATHADLDTPVEEPEELSQGSTSNTEPPMSTGADTGAPHPSSGGEAAPQPVTGAASQGQDDSEDETAAADDAEAITWAPSALHTAGGVGALLAAGIAGLLLARRRQAARTCPPGARVALPAPGGASAEFEQQLHAIADPIGRDAVNVALRDLAAHAEASGQPAPAVLFARYAGDGTELQLYLAEPAALPQPWVASTDQQVWSITDHDLATQVLPRTKPQDAVAAYPALVGLGIGDQDAHLLVDLERLGHLDLRGDDQTAHGVLAALMLELVTSQWADDLQVTVVGGHPELLEALQSPRALYLDTPRAALDRLDNLATDPHQHSSGQWPPEVVFFAAELTSQDRDRLAAVLERPVPGLAVVTIGSDRGEAAIELRPGTLEATLLPSGMPIRAQHLSPVEYREVVAALDVHCVPGPAWTTTLAQAREPTIDTLPEPDPGQLEPVEAAEPLFSVEHTSPVVRVLGPVELVGTDTAVLSGTIGHLHAAVEMAAYLCLHDGATTTQLTSDLWPNQDIKPATRHSAISRTRRLLGTTPDGRARLEAETSSGSTRYYLTDVVTDWEDFIRLRGPDPTTTPLADLRRALALVRGAPFSQVRDGVGRVRANRYLWADTLALEMTASIVDVACEAARRALLDGKPRLAAEVADAGLRASTDHERLWRYAIRARTQMGEHAAVAELVDALTQRLTELDVDPEPETNQLLDDVAGTTSQAAS